MIRATIGAMVVTAMLLPAAASAKWFRAESTNYIVYSDGSEADLRERVVALEKFGDVLAAMTGAKRTKEVPVKIKIYFVSSATEVQNSLPFSVGSGLAGYYETSMRGPYEVMPRQSLEAPGGSRIRSAGLDANIVLRHELTHHFTFQYFPAAYPAWYTEGIADYAGAIEIDKDDKALIGLYLDDRASALRQMSWVPLSRLMNPPKEGLGEDAFAVYSEGWITVHYFNQNDEGKAKLREYLMAINRGASFADAMKVFGDINELDRKVHAYAMRRDIPASFIQFKNLNAGPIDMKPLSPAEEALVDIDMHLNSGIPQSRARAFAARVAGVVRSYPTDPHALEDLIEAQRLADDISGASTTVNAWLTAQPDNPWALFHRGSLDIDALAAAKSQDDNAWMAARAKIAAAMKAMPDEPRILRGYYESYAKRGGKMPPASAQNALAHALDLIPGADELRYEVASDYEKRGYIQDAIDTIAPIAFGQVDETEKEKRRRLSAQKEYKIAGRPDNETPREMLARLEKKKAGVGGSGDVAKDSEGKKSGADKSKAQ